MINVWPIVLNNYGCTPSVDCSQIAAAAYNRVIAVYSEIAGNILLLPFRSESPDVHRSIILCLEQTMEYCYFNWRWEKASKAHLVNTIASVRTDML